MSTVEISFRETAMKESFDFGEGEIVTANLKVSQICLIVTKLICYVIQSVTYLWSSLICKHDINLLIVQRVFCILLCSKIDTINYSVH